MQQAVRDALIGFMAATSQAQAEATKAAQRAGICDLTDQYEEFQQRQALRAKTRAQSKAMASPAFP
jgi:putative DNA-invertase from lambdoid prophage Rac